MHACHASCMRMCAFLPPPLLLLLLLLLLLCPGFRLRYVATFLCSVSVLLLHVCAGPQACHSSVYQIFPGV